MLILPLQVTHGMLSHPIVGFDVVWSRNARGEPSEVQEADRTFVGNLQPAKYKDVKLIPEGAQAGGVLVLHAAITEISMAGNRNGGQDNRQTYVRSNGDVWKVSSRQNWNPHSQIGKWLLTRYVDVSGAVV